MTVVLASLCLFACLFTLPSTLPIFSLHVSVGAEYRSFLLYWGPIVLRYILDEDRYLHFLLLSSAITLFLGLSITAEDVNLGEEMIYLYLAMYPELYGKSDTDHPPSFVAKSSVCQKERKKKKKNHKK